MKLPVKPFAGLHVGGGVINVIVAVCVSVSPFSYQLMVRDVLGKGRCHVRRNHSGLRSENGNFEGVFAAYDIDVPVAVQGVTSLVD